MGQFAKFFGKNSPFLPKRGLTPHPLCVTIKLYVNLSVSLTLASHSPFGTFVPPPPAGGVFPNRGALGRMVQFLLEETGPIFRQGVGPALSGEIILRLRYSLS